MQKAMHCWLPCDNSSVAAECAPTQQTTINDELRFATAKAMHMFVSLDNRLHATTTTAVEELKRHCWMHACPATKTIAQTEKLCVAGRTQIQML
jgi:hypothetical protein